MRQGKILICLLTILLLGAVWLTGEEKTENDVLLTAVVTVGDREETVELYATSSWEMYLFLPGGAELSQVRLYDADSANYTVNGHSLPEEGLSCEDFVLNTPYPAAMEFQNFLFKGTLTFLRSDSVGSLFVDVRSGNMDFIHQQKGNAESGSLRLYHPDGTLNHAGQIQTINGRGNSTWEMPKKSYSLELSLSADLLDMGSAKKWILTSNSMDATNLRNKLVYDFAQRAGLAYSPECRWVNLYLNGEYAGLYLLCERNEVHAERVNIAGTGGFLVSRDFPWRLREQGRTFVTTQSGTALRIYHSEMDQETMTSLWQSAENAILAEDGVDPFTGKRWDELIDVESWARKYLLEELFANTDGAVLSQYFYCDGSGKLYAGPVWDYDLTMGNNLDIPDQGVQAMYANQEQVQGGAWYAALYEKKEFYDQVTHLYETEFRPLLQQMREQALPEYLETIRAAAAMNDVRWYVPDGEVQVGQLVDYLPRRMDFLDRLWLSETKHHRVRIVADAGYTYNYMVPDGECIPDLPEYHEKEGFTCLGWRYADTEEPVDLERPVHADTTIWLTYVQEEPDREAPAPTEMPGTGSEDSRIPKTAFLPVLLLVCLVPVLVCIEMIRKKGGLRRP